MKKTILTGLVMSALLSTAARCANGDYVCQWITYDDVHASAVADFLNSTCDKQKPFSTSTVKDGAVTLVCCIQK